MQIFGRVISSVSEFYKDLNPSTLSGAVDVVVVEDVGSGRLACSPFHVRFGKLQVLRPSEKKVEIEVNGQAVPDVSMKIGLAGETFFVLPVDGPVPSEYQTSPLPQPIPADATKVPSITLASPHKVLPEPLSDSEITTGIRKKIVVAKSGALSDSELDTIGTQHQLQQSGPAEDEWTWKWGDLPERDHDHEHVHGTDADKPLIQLESTVELVSTPTDGEKKEIDEIEALLLDQKQEEQQGEKEAEEGKEKTVKLQSYLSQRETVSLMYERLEAIIAEGMDEVELCLYHLNPEQSAKPSDLSTLKSINDSLRSVAWEEFEADPNGVVTESTAVCVFGPSTNTAVFRTKGAVQMLVGLRLYKRLIPLERLLAMYPVEEVSDVAPPVPAKPSESILSWRQWWSSPRSQSAKMVPGSPSKSPKKADEAGREEVKPPSMETIQPAAITPILANSAATAVSSVTQVSPTKEIQRAASTPDLAASPHTNYSKSLRLPSEDLKKLGLHYGMNTITFSVITSKNGKATCTARIFLWRSDERIVISDIDGTITKSDALGHLFQFVGKDWTHLGVAQLYTDIAKNGYRFLYLTSRPIGQANSTRGYLRGIEQNRYQLPEGPVIMSPDRFFMAVRREVIEGNPEQFKIPCLLDIRRLFYPRPLGTEYDPMGMTEAERSGTSPFYAGFGNRHTDALSYQAVGINAGRIYIINPSGDLSLQIITGYRSSYVKLVDLVDKVFPPLNQAIERDRHARSLSAENLVDQKDQVVTVASTTVGGEEEEYNDFFFWRQTIQTLNHTTAFMQPISSALLPASTSDEIRPDESTTDLTVSESRADDEETSSERGDQYYFEEDEEAGLIPFA